MFLYFTVIDSSPSSLTVLRQDKLSIVVITSAILSSLLQNASNLPKI